MTMILILSLLSVYVVQSSSTINPCLNYCSTGGICLRTENGPKCICSPKWTGEHCEIAQQSNTSRTNRTESRIDPCDYAPSNYCQNGGVCYVSNNEYACQCRYPYEGKNCQRFSVCDGYCYNGGYCTVNATNGLPECTCTAGQTGLRCRETLATTTDSAIPATTIMQCAYLKCGLGTCVLENNRAKCVCPSRYTGVQCESQIVGPTPVTPLTSSGPGPTCAAAPCKNGGRCYNNGNSYFCLCNPQNNGKNCEN